MSPIEKALRELLAASEHRAIVSAVQHFTRSAEKQAFMKARQAAKRALAALDEQLVCRRLFTRRTK